MKNMAIMNPNTEKFFCVILDNFKVLTTTIIIIIILVIILLMSKNERVRNWFAKVSGETMTKSEREKPAVCQLSNNVTELYKLTDTEAIEAGIKGYVNVFLCETFAPQIDLLRHSPTVVGAITHQEISRETNLLHKGYLYFHLPVYIINGQKFGVIHIIPSPRVTFVPSNPRVFQRGPGNEWRIPLNNQDQE